MNPNNPKILIVNLRQMMEQVEKVAPYHKEDNICEELNAPTDKGICGIMAKYYQWIIKPYHKYSYRCFSK